MYIHVTSSPVQPHCKDSNDKIKTPEVADKTWTVPLSSIEGGWI